MEKEPFETDTRKPLPRSLVIGVIVITAGITVAAMSMTGLRGPALAWDRANRTIETVWSDDRSGSSMDDQRRLPQDPSNAAVPVAALPNVPVIVAGAPMIHVDRGACTNCHGVVTQLNAPVPSIYALSAMTHEYRGVCTNCHQLKVAPPGFNPVAATNITRPGPDPVQPGIGMGPAPKIAARQPAEAEWQGLEVGPSPLGVVVNGAEAAARTTGMRAGDLVTSINGIPIRTMVDFVRVTDRGALPQGAIIVRRDGQRLAFELGGAARTAAPPPQTVPFGVATTPKPEVQF